MAPLLRGSIVLALLLVLVVDAQTLKYRNDTATADVTAVALNNSATFSVCVYPTSGSYSFLSRLLYYCTLVFSLFSKSHLWLVAGALAAALTYSGTAAIHACLLAWRGPNPYIEQDYWSLMTILTSASLITVPLLNWSGTLRRLGAKTAAMRDRKGTHTQSDVATRTIVVYWAFLVLVGYICIWQQTRWGDQSTGEEFPDMGKVICRPGTNGSQIRGHDGNLIPRAIDREFIMKNGCNNPCNQVQVHAIFRQNDDLQLMTVTQALLYAGYYPTKGYARAGKTQEAQDNIADVYFYTLPFILLQGFITVFFGRRDPREIRDFIFVKLYMEHPQERHPAFLAIQDWSARIIAFLSYIVAVLMVLICPPLFLLLVGLHEWGGFLEVPDSEAPKSVGQWGPWAVAGQAIAAALIAKYHDKVIGLLGKILGPSWDRVFHRHRYTDFSVDAKANSTTRSSSPDPEAGLKPDYGTKSTQKDARPPPPRLASGIGTDPEQSFSQDCKDTIIYIYQAFTHPLNQSNGGIGDECKNFFRWCRDPKAVSRKVVRYPLRSMDGETVKERAEARGEPQGNDRGFFRAASTRRPEYREREREREEGVVERDMAEKYPSMPIDASYHHQGDPRIEGHRRTGHERT